MNPKYNSAASKTSLMPIGVQTSVAGTFVTVNAFSTRNDSFTFPPREAVRKKEGNLNK
jgi:hypothetical protein